VGNAGDTGQTRPPAATAASIPAICAATKAGTPAGAIPEKVSDSARHGDGRCDSRRKRHRDASEKPMILARILHVLACSVALIATDCAHGQTARPPVRPDAGNPAAPGYTPVADGAAYCPDLKRLAALAATKDRFADIAGRPREGNFVETTLPLAGWRNCAIYGRRSYTCDSDTVATAAAAENRQATILKELKECLGKDWSEVEERSSSNYVVLHDAGSVTSITLSTDLAEGGHLVHLIIFAR
jgi:hypothetical protein